MTHICHKMAAQLPSGHTGWTHEHSIADTLAMGPYGKRPSALSPWFGVGDHEAVGPECSMAKLEIRLPNRLPRRWPTEANGRSS